MKKLALFLLLAVSAFAADIDGKWTGNIESPNGPIALSYTFKADGNTLTGSMAGPDGMEIKIDNGMIDGNNLSFSVTINFGEAFTLAYKGVLNGAELKLTSDFGGQPFEMVLKKS